jgi:hypothetical protein
VLRQRMRQRERDPGADDEGEEPEAPCGHASGVVPHAVPRRTVACPSADALVRTHRNGRIAAGARSVRTTMKWEGVATAAAHRRRDRAPRQYAGGLPRRRRAPGVVSARSGRGDGRRALDAAGPEHGAAFFDLLRALFTCWYGVGAIVGAYASRIDVLAAFVCVIRPVRGRRPPGGPRCEPHDDLARGVARRPRGRCDGPEPRPRSCSPRASSTCASRCTCGPRCRPG